MAAGGWIVSDRLRSSSDVYGTFAVVIGLLAWIYLGAQVTLLGAELNAVVARRLWPRSLIGDDMTRADLEALERSARQEERKEHEIVDVRFDEAGASEPMAGSGAADRKRSIGTLVDERDRWCQRNWYDTRWSSPRSRRERPSRSRLEEPASLAGAGVAALFALGFIAAAGAVGLAIVLPLWVSLLIVAGVFVLIGAVLFIAGTPGAEGASRHRQNAGEREGGCSMGEAADRKMKEIDVARSRVEDDLRELEGRLPRPVRSAKAATGAVVGQLAHRSEPGMADAPTEARGSEACANRGGRRARRAGRSSVTAAGGERHRRGPQRSVFVAGHDVIMRLRQAGGLRVVGRAETSVDSSHPRSDCRVQSC